MFIDTQIISRHINEGRRFGNGYSISSIVAKELLECYDKKHLLRDKYYILPPYSDHPKILKLSKERLRHPAFSGFRGDVIEICFGLDYPRVREHGSRAISQVINSGTSHTVNRALNFHKPKNKSALRERFRGIIRSGVSCEPLTSQDVHVAFEILSKFTRRYKIKGDFRNSLNDILILATAVRTKRPLKTLDTLLANFAAECFGATRVQSKTDLIIDFAQQNEATSGGSRESKGYVHRGWRIAVQKDRIRRKNY